VSCGGLHGRDGAVHLHEPEGHHPDGNENQVPGGPADPGSNDAPASAQELQDDGASVPANRSPAKHAREPKPNRVLMWLAGTWRSNRYITKPFLWAGSADLAVLATHALTAGHPLAGLLTAVGGGLAAEIGSEVVNKRAKRSEPWRKMSRQEVAIGTVWAMLATGWTPTGWLDIVQWLALGGSLALGGNHAWEEHKARHEAPAPAWPAEPEPVQAAEELPAIEPQQEGPDSRLVLFTDRFCQPGGPLEGVDAEFKELPHGFVLSLYLPVDSHHSMASVRGLTTFIAKLYDVAESEVSVGYMPDKSTERRCQVIVQTSYAVATATRDKSWNVWDGACTFDFETGCIDLGRFTDDHVTHYELFAPRSGAKIGFAAGAPGKGKSTTLGVICGDAGQAMLCSRCGHRRQCYECDLHRVIAIWMGDPQKQGFGYWRGRADLVGWGAEGYATLIDLADAVADARGQVLANRETWDTGPDGKRRVTEGQGWFDLEIGFPGIVLALDELAKFARHPDQDMVLHALRIIADGILEWRKVGIHPLFGSHMLDLTHIKSRELRDLIKYFTFIAHQTDEVSADLGGVLGDPRLLPREASVGFINGIDERSGDRFYTKFAREIRKADDPRGTDLRHVAGLISQMPMQYDVGTYAVMETWGIRHQEVLTEWHGRPVDQGAVVQGSDGASADVPAGSTSAGGGFGLGGLAYRDHVEKVVSVMQDNPGADIGLLMKETGLTLLEIGRALDTAEANHLITRTEQPAA